MPDTSLSFPDVNDNALFRSPTVLRQGSVADITGRTHPGAIGAPPLNDSLPGKSPNSSRELSRSFEATITSLESAGAELAKSIKDASTDAEKIARYLGTATEHAASISQSHESAAKAVAQVNQATTGGAGATGGAQGIDTLLPTGYISGAPTTGAPLAPETYVRLPGQAAGGPMAGGLGGAGAPAPPWDRKPTSTGGRGVSDKVDVMQVGRLEVGGQGGAPGGPAGTAPVGGGARDTHPQGGGPVPRPPSESDPEAAKAERGRQFQRMRGISTVGGAARMGAEILGQHMENYQPGALRPVDEAEVPEHQRQGAARGKDGQYYADRQTGEVETSQGRVDRHERTNRRYNSARGHLGSFAEGAGAGSMLSSLGGIGSKLGGAGLVAGTAFKGFEAADQELQSQWRQNAYFQRIEGTSNFGAIPERAHERMFELSQQFPPGGLGTEQARRAFAGTTELGLTGGQRSNALDLITGNYSQFGMTVDQSLQLVKVATQNAKTNFSDLSDVLQNVTQSAKDAGINTDQAREKFVAYYSAAVQGGAGGPAASQIAQNLTNFQSTFGRQGQNVDFRGLLQPNNIETAGAMMGLRGSQLEAREAYGGVDPKTGKFQSGGWWAAQQQQTASRPLQQTLTSNPQIAKILDDFRRAHPGKNGQPGSASQGDLDRLKYQLMDTGLLSETFATQMLAAEGINAQGMDAIDQATQQLIDPDRAARVNQQNENAAAIQKKGVPGARVSGADINAEKGQLGDPQDFMHRKHQFQIPDRVQSYESGFLNRGVRVPVMEKMLKDHGDEKVIVRGPGGDRTVSMSDAIKYYPGQVESGQARFSSTGQTITSATGTAPIQDPSVTGRASDEEKRNAGHRVSGAANQPGTGKITISATPYLQKLFNFAGSGDVGSNNPNTNPTPDPNSLPPGSAR